MKACSRCGESKDDAEFSRDAYQRSGLRSLCRDCISASRAADRAAAIAVYGGECAMCHSKEDLEFDHIDGDGWKHRLVEDSYAMVRRIVRTGGPLQDYRLRVLCWSCHHSRGMRERLAPETWLPLFPWEHLLERDPDCSGGAVVLEAACDDPATDGPFGDAEG